MLEDVSTAPVVADVAMVASSLIIVVAVVVGVGTAVVVTSWCKAVVADASDTDDVDDNENVDGEGGRVTISKDSTGEEGS